MSARYLLNNVPRGVHKHEQEKEVITVESAMMPETGTKGCNSSTAQPTMRRARHAETDSNGRRPAHGGASVAEHLIFKYRGRQ